MFERIRRDLTLNQSFPNSFMLQVHTLVLCGSKSRALIELHVDQQTARYKH